MGFSLAVMPTAQVPEAVRQGAADIGLCFSRAPQKDIAVLYRQPAPVLALMPPGHALADRASVYAQWDLPLGEALQQEWQRGKARIPDALEGATRFAAGQGRHGQF